MTGRDEQRAKYETDAPFLHVGEGGGDLTPFFIDGFCGANVGDGVGERTAVVEGIVG